MGRLTLNVFLSFAQFEREVTGERIRDKIAASKKNGIWMGGTVPLDENRQGGKRKPRATKTSVFAGLLFDAEGTFYTPTHASKNGRRYRYYTS